jgi:hypothetical protein
MLSILCMMFCSDLSVWCFACDSYLDVQAILELRPIYEIAHLLKFGERPPFRSLDVLDLSCGGNESSSSQSSSLCSVTEFSFNDALMRLRETYVFYITWYLLCFGTILFSLVTVVCLL